MYTLPLKLQYRSLLVNKQLIFLLFETWLWIALSNNFSFVSEISGAVKEVCGFKPGQSVANKSHFSHWVCSKKIEDEECLHRLNHPTWFGHFIDNISK